MIEALHTFGKARSIRCAHSNIDAGTQPKLLKVLPRPRVLQFVKDLGNRVVCLGQPTDRGERKQGSCIQNKAFAAWLSYRCSHNSRMARGLVRIEGISTMKKKVWRGIRCRC